MSVILGLGGGYFHDAAAAIVVDGVVKAFVEEERFTRVKHAENSLDCSRSVAYCLAEAELRFGDIDEIVVCWNRSWPQEVERSDDASLISQLLSMEVCDGHPPRSVKVTPHHMGHAASAFLCSPFSEAAVLVTDGSGDGIATSVWKGSDGGLTCLASFPYTQSLGWFYEGVTSYLGLGGWGNVGKLMGLAPYGSPTVDLDFIQPSESGYLLKLDQLGLVGEPDPADYRDLSFYRELRHAYHRTYDNLGLQATFAKRYYDAMSGGVPVIADAMRGSIDLAASAQAKLTACLEALVRQALSSSGSSNICLAGGVALNCTANGSIWANVKPKGMFIQPAAGDAGLALGGALLNAWDRGEFKRGAGAWNTALGPEFSQSSIRRVLFRSGLSFTELGDDGLRRVADLVAQGKVLGWFDGRSEGGPRALGNRSIIARPDSVALRDRINSQIKNRETWRPFAASMSERAARELLVDPDGPFDHMVAAVDVQPRKRSLVEGAVHVDGSTRPQVVRNDATRYGLLLGEVGRSVGIEALLNTSFNSEAEPIVNSPSDAIRTYVTSELDGLVLGDFLLLK